MKVTYSKSFIYGQAMFWGGLILFISLFLGFRFYRSYQRSKFEPYLSQYLEKPQNELLKKEAAAQNSIVISGKLVTININDNSIDPLLSSLPAELNPATPEEIKTILWLNCRQRESMFKYTDGVVGLETDCDLTFIDAVYHKYLWRDSIHTLPPPRKSRGSSPIPDPTEDILKYLKNISHQE